MRLWLILPALIAAVLGPRAPDAQQVDFVIDATLPVRDTELPYTLDLNLTAAAPTRIGVGALLDLREVQKVVPERLADNAIVDNCGLQVRLDDLSFKAEDQVIDLDGDVTITIFECSRTGERNFERGEEKRAILASLSTEATVEVRDNCAYFKLIDLTLTAPEEQREQLLEDDTLDSVKELMLAAVDLALNDTPLCPELPAELASLDPTYDKGGPREIGEGGLGVLLEGSVDVSPSTILDILTVLQEQELIPGRP
ncbi:MULTISPECIES: hypothetical protein [unclassified Ruegeria]|uniref:hypothetical protein n=1 Tax=unclassified Ruegeria TaxID=2625375 RepID=UPI001489E3E7|nr:MULTISPECIES: hypothetical protein [unclassified Ruegeria]NOD49099.1 hypothetical protein [Ruegeria sp. HKCCD5849]NOD51663.1 hypothetical protein [Ruegeria sp. HKCCD5851]NOD68649.1 hypothetical protein [Ruegeria sp. HKCCD7303]NOE34925.1 hypothetical protein [Ruegeria sp. HKCCD7318]